MQGMGFTTERLFVGEALARYAGIDGDALPDGVTLIVRITNPTRFHLRALAARLRQSVQGGYRTAILDVAGLAPRVVSAADLWVAVEMADEEREDRKDRFRESRLAA